MPEGPEIRRAADQLVRAVVNKPLTDVWFAFPELQPYQSALIAHWNEMHQDGIKIARPRQLYTGYDKRDFSSQVKKK